MAMKISFINQKGGVGKTTLSVNVADAFARMGKKTLLVDADEQGSAMEWSVQRAKMREEGDGPVLFPVVSLAVPNLRTELGPMNQDYDCIVIDGSPRVNKLGAAVVMASDLVLIPMMPSSLDVWATDEMVDLVDEGRGYKAELGEDLAAGFVLNRKKSQTKLGQTVSSKMKLHKVPLLRTEVSDRIDFAKAVAKGRTVLETAPKGPAAQEITQLANDIMELFDDQGRLIQHHAA